jgi:hypothetical protein
MLHVPLSRSSCLLAGAMLAACTSYGDRASTGMCPSGEVCSPSTPSGLHFFGPGLADELLWLGPYTTAVGGTQDIRLRYQPEGFDRTIDLDLPYHAQADGTPIAVEKTEGPVVTLRGTADGEDYLRIVDPDTGELYDRRTFRAAAIEAIRLTGTTPEMRPAENALGVWTPGERELAVALHSGNGRLVDTSMQIDVSGGERIAWDTVRLSNAQVGVYPVTVTAGDRPATTLELEIVAGPTEIVSISGDTLTVAENDSVLVCFAAMHEARFVHGLAWAFRVDGEPPSSDFPISNCVAVQGTESAGTITVEASAGGLTKTVIVEVGAAARVDAPVASSVDLPGERAAGDRARMVLGSQGIDRPLQHGGNE